MTGSPLRARYIGVAILAALMLYAVRSPGDNLSATVSSAGDKRDLDNERPVPRHQLGWGPILGHVWLEMGRDNISMMAAGVAFYGLLAIFPGMSALISIYGLAADPMLIERHVEAFAGVLPSEALKLLSDQLHALVAAPPAKLGISLIISLMVALWSATSGTSMLMQTLTIAYEETEHRGLFHFYGLAIALTFGMFAFVLVALLLIAGAPAVLSRLPLTDLGRDAVSLIRWPILAVVVMLGLGILYRLAPCRHRPRWDVIRAGTVAASLVWLIGSAGFAFYVGRFGSYDRTYGSLGAVVVLLMWFWVTAYIILAGAELNAEVARARRGTNQWDPRLSA